MGTIGYIIGVTRQIRRQIGKSEGNQKELDAMEQFHKGNRQEGLRLQEEFASAFREEFKDKDHCLCKKACRYHGNCKECNTAGISESTPLTEESFGLSHRMTAKSLGKIGQIGGPLCRRLNITKKYIQNNYWRIYYEGTGITESIGFSGT